MPDPAARFQPEGVHGWSEVVDPSCFEWTDDGWGGLALSSLVIYELHVGTFTPDGTFDATRSRLPELADLGVTAIELMPVHDFPGTRGWGYDPAALFAPCRAYGRPDDLRRLVDAAHANGIGVILDVVYNHLGPDGAYFGAYGPALTPRHHTPWGLAMNFDGPHSRGVRDFIVENALHWLREYHVDGLRLDATFALADDSSEHVLAELSRRVEALPGPRRLLIAEHDRDVGRVLAKRSEGGFGLDAVWVDDFHHIVRRIVVGRDPLRHVRDLPATTQALARCIERGQHAEQGSHPPAEPFARERLVYFIQNHDQIGNRPRGDRLHHHVDLATWRAVSALLLFAPETPLLFMGQEFAASSPFRYFTDHHDALGRAVRRSRERELAADSWTKSVPDVPDPQAGETFGASVLDWGERRQAPCCEVLRLYRDFLALRRELSGEIRAWSPAEGVIVATRGRHMLIACVKRGGEVVPPVPGIVRLDTESARYRGGGSAVVAVSAEHREPACVDDVIDEAARIGVERMRFDGPRALVIATDTSS